MPGFVRFKGSDGAVATGLSSVSALPSSPPGGQSAHCPGYLGWPDSPITILPDLPSSLTK